MRKLAAFLFNRSAVFYSWPPITAALGVNFWPDSRAIDFAAVIVQNQDDVP